MVIKRQKEVMNKAVVAAMLYGVVHPKVKPIKSPTQVGANAAQKSRNMLSFGLDLISSLTEESIEDTERQLLRDG